MSAVKGLEIVGFGAGAEDFYLPIGDIRDDYEPGGKVGWTAEDDVMLAQLLAAGHQPYIGGNALNPLAYLAKSDLDAHISMATALGPRDDRTSRNIRADLNSHGIRVLAGNFDDYRPSVSLIERADGDRMVRGRARTPLGKYITSRQIKMAADPADVILVASLKDYELTQKIFEMSSEDAFISYNPGSSEFRDPAAIIELMKLRRLGLIAVNNDEAAALLGARPDDDPKELTNEMGRFAKNALVSFGKRGLGLKKGDRPAIFRSAPEIPPKNVIDTLGAGDRVHGAVLYGIVADMSEEAIAEGATTSAAEGIQVIGAHGDLHLSNAA